MPKPLIIGLTNYAAVGGMAIRSYNSKTDKLGWKAIAIKKIPDDEVYETIDL